MRFGAIAVLYFSVSDRLWSVKAGENAPASAKWIAVGVMSYVLVPDGSGTRLLLKIVTPGLRWLAPLLSVGDLVMARRQLLNLKQLAERHGS